MKRSLKAALSLIKISSLMAFEYRADIFLQSAVRLFESLASFLLVAVMFTQINEVSGWSRSQVLLINLTYTLTTSLTYFLFRYGAKDFAKNLNRGDLDKYLVKPLNIQIFVSLGGLDWTQSLRLIGSLAALIYFSRLTGLEFTWLSGAFFIGLVCCSALVMYSLGFILATLILNFGRLNNVAYLTQIIWDLGRMPSTVFHPGLQILFATVFPVIISATLPVGLLTFKYPPAYFFYGLLLTVAFLIASQLFLRFSIRRYTSSGG